MDFPILMPKELTRYLQIEDEIDVLEALKKNEKDLLLFLETACHDETWMSNHEFLMKEIFLWLTDCGLANRISSEVLTGIYTLIHQFYFTIKEYLPNNISVKLNDEEVLYNSLLLMGSSNFFKQIFFSENVRQNGYQIAFQITKKEFDSIACFVATGQFPHLETMGVEELIVLIKRSKAWEILSLAELAEITLSKYLSSENIFEMYTLAKEEDWPYFAQLCLNFINKEAIGFRFYSYPSGRVGFEFLDFYEKILTVFNQYFPFITDIICKDRLTERVEFGRILNRSLHLKGLNINSTENFSFELQNISPSLESLNLSECLWLSKEKLKFFSIKCPDLKELILQNNSQLNYSAWAELIHFKGLKKLDLSYCAQLQDSDLSLILKGLESLTELSLSHCKKIGEKGMLEIGQRMPKLVRLNLSKCAVSDATMIQIASCCPFLIALNLAGCSYITKKGISLILKQNPGLKELIAS